MRKRIKEIRRREERVYKNENIRDFKSKQRFYTVFQTLSLKIDPFLVINKCEQNHPRSSKI